MTHDLKTWPQPFAAVRAGRKRFEYRKDDRGFGVGDLLRLRKWDPKTGEYSGDWVTHAITYIARGPDFDIPEGYAVLSLSERLDSAPPMKFIRGNILDDPSDLLVVPVCCVPGVMGAGLAKAFADRWPGLKDVHRNAVDVCGLTPGTTCPVWIRPDRPADRISGVIFFPTKDHWRDPSRLEWIEDGLDALAQQIRYYADPQWSRRIRSVALPALGCGLGGLDWAVVRPMIEAWAHTLPDDIDVTLYEPEDYR